MVSAIYKYGERPQQPDEKMQPTVVLTAKELAALDVWVTDKTVRTEIRAYVPSSVSKRHEIILEGSSEAQSWFNELEASAYETIARIYQKYGAPTIREPLPKLNLSILTGDSPGICCVTARGECYVEIDLVRLSRMSMKDATDLAPIFWTLFYDTLAV